MQYHFQIVTKTNRGEEGALECIVKTGGRKIAAVRRTEGSPAVRVFECTEVRLSYDALAEAKTQLVEATGIEQKKTEIFAQLSQVYDNNKRKALSAKLHQELRELQDFINQDQRARIMELNGHA